VGIADRNEDTARRNLDLRGRELGGEQQVERALVRADLDSDRMAMSAAAAIDATSPARIITPAQMVRISAAARSPLGTSRPLIWTFPLALNGEGA
jgi:hypothetical protein